MSWFELIKSPNPHGGNWRELTREQYVKLHWYDKKLYHGAMSSSSRLRGETELQSFHNKEYDKIRGEHSVSYFSLNDKFMEEGKSPKEEDGHDLV